MLRKSISVIVWAVVFCMVFSTFAYAADVVSGDNLVSKESSVFEKDENTFKIKLKVPGVDGSDLHDEVILMVDGSYSGDSEWPLMKEAITNIGKTVLNGTGNTQLTLMAFGMGDNEVLVHVKSAEELTSALGELPGNLLYGRSSTNCESGFTGVEEYIENHDDTLNTAHVLYISDGGVNTDETPYDFFNWKENTWLRWPVQTIIESNFDAECSAVAGGANRSEAFVSLFGEDSDIEDVAESATYEQKVQWSDKLWADVYEYSNLVPGNEYPVSDVERAFVKYDKENNTYVQDNFYYALVGRSYPNKAARTIASAKKLADNKLVASMYIVDNNATTAWMKGIEGTEFVPAGSISNIYPALEEALTNLAQTPFNDVVVCDYMSKWVNLDPSTIAVVDDITGKTIWTASEGWLIDSDERPTSEEVPVKVELVSPQDYADGGADTDGNTSGDIYKLTWTVKDGAMLRSDSYHLEYIVKADTEEEGFKYNVSYPSNGNTSVSYKDEDGNDKENDVAVPDITTEKEKDEITFSDVKYAYIFGHEPEIKKVTNEDGTVSVDVKIRMGMDDSVTVEQVCAMISRAIDQELDSTPASYPATVTAGYEGEWYYRGISYLDSLGAFENHKQAKGPATRAQVAQLISLGLKLDNASEEVNLDDISGNKYEEHIKRVVARGYMEGVGDGRFSPDRVMTRAEFCKLFNNILGKTGYGLTAKNEDGSTYEVTAESYHFVDMSASHWGYNACLVATSAYFEDGLVDMDTRLANIRNKIDRYDDQKDY